MSAAPHPAAPDYGRQSLSRLLPAVTASLGVPVDERWQDGDLVDLPPARSSVVVLVDGLGERLLRRRSGHAPFLRGLLPGAEPSSAGFPSTTATSMGSFGTGRTPGEHGLLGYEVLVPGEDRVFNELSWEDGPSPRMWQPSETVFAGAARQGIEVVRIGPGFFDGSGLTEAALRGGRFVAADTLAQRVDAALAALRAGPRTLVYLYWGDLDKVGHVHGCESWQWGDELEAIDAEMARLARSLPGDTSLHITADHGMVDVPLHHRLDLAHDAELDAGVRHLGGEARALQLYVEDGAVGDVLTTWRERLSGTAAVVSRDEAIAAGWFGGVTDVNAARIGDVIAAMTGQFAVVDSRRQRKQLLELLGLHGSLSADELAIPWLRVPARTNA